MKRVPLEQHFLAVMAEAFRERNRIELERQRAVGRAYRALIERSRHVTLNQFTDAAAEEYRKVLTISK